MHRAYTPIAIPLAVAAALAGPTLLGACLFASAARWPSDPLLAAALRVTGVLVAAMVPAMLWREHRRRSSH